MLQDYRVTHVLWVFGNAGFGGGIHILDLSRGNAKAWSNKIKFQNSKFLTKVRILSSFVSVFQKYHLFLRTKIGNTKNTFQKVTSSSLPGFRPLQR